LGRTDLWRAGLGALLFLMALMALAASPGSAQNPSELTAVLTQIEGQVTLSPEGGAKFRSVHVAAPRQVVRRGELVHVPAGAQAALICSTEALVRLTGPRDWVLDAASCGRGIALPESSYRNLTAYAGRILPRNGALLLELETRNVDVGPGPLLLSPRNTAVIAPSPRLVWTRVPEAVDYEIEIRGTVRTTLRVAANDLPCGPESGAWRGLDICTWTPTARWPALEPDQKVYLRLGSRQTSTAPFHPASEVFPIRLLSALEQRNVQENVRQIEKLPIDRPDRLLLTAAAYAHHELLADAIATYDEALRAQELPEARVTLGDLYLTLGLIPLAEREYRQVLAGGPPPVVQAAAELGLGDATGLRKRFREARDHFERAQEIYTTLGLPAEAAEARDAAAGLRP
jgi:hypothetical protein